MNKSSLMALFAISACTANAGDIEPSLNMTEFGGFNIDNKTSISDITLTGYEYETKGGGQVKFDNCAKAVMFGESNVKGYELFRLRLLTNACHALEKYLAVKPSNKSFFSSKFEPAVVRNFPAATMPMLYRAQDQHRGDKTIKQYYSSYKTNIEKNRSIKLLSEEDEIYYTLMARGDFTNDGIEDLLIKSEWFARKARGKHVDLLILTKKGREQPVKIHWRLMKF